MATDVAKAWKECQKRGVLYCDIHICNIYRSDDGTFKLGDFGSCTNDLNIKETVGNQWFMAPETFVSGIFAETSAVYSISMVMYFILNNLRPAFWTQGCEDEALRTRMYGCELPTPIGCINIPPHLKTKLDNFFRSTSASLPKERISSIEKFIYELEKLTSYCGNQYYVIHRKGISLTLDLDAGNSHRLDERWIYIPRDAYHQYALGNKVEQMCTTAMVLPASVYPYDITPADQIISVDEVENFARTMASNLDVPSTITPFINITDEVASYSSTMRFCENKLATYNATVQKSKKSIWSKLFGNKYNEVYSSIFTPTEVKLKSHLQVQVYLHLYEESEKVKSFAQESDKNAERRDYIPLSLKLKKGDKVDVEFNVYGETRLASDRKLIVWQGSYTKCSFDYFVPKDIDVEELSCEANLFVNGAMIGEMRFLTQIVEVPRNLNPEILSHRFNRIFISYAHQDAQQIKLLALAYKAQGVDYFYDKDSLAPGDVYEEKIFDYIDSSDLFVLCWSKNAAVSDYVAKEKGQALLRAYPQLSQREATLKICPISIEPRADLPSDMKEVYNFEVI